MFQFSCLNKGAPVCHASSMDKNSASGLNKEKESLEELEKYFFFIKTNVHFMLELYVIQSLINREFDSQRKITRKHLSRLWLQNNEFNISFPPHWSRNT